MRPFEMVEKLLLVMKPALGIVHGIAVDADVLGAAKIVLPIDKRQVRPRVCLGEHEKEKRRGTKQRRGACAVGRLSNRLLLT